MNSQATAAAAPTAAETLTPLARSAQAEPNATRALRLGLPKGRMQKGLFQLLSDAGLPVRETARGYRPRI
ncbi:MAG: hypothetical protein ACYS26_09965, partial [Planctomycetota bacterium]